MAISNNKGRKNNKKDLFSSFDDIFKEGCELIDSSKDSEKYNDDLLDAFEQPRKEVKQTKSKKSKPKKSRLKASSIFDIYDGVFENDSSSLKTEYECETDDISQYSEDSESSVIVLREYNEVKEISGVISDIAVGSESSLVESTVIVDSVKSPIIDGDTVEVIRDDVDFDKHDISNDVVNSDVHEFKQSMTIKEFTQEFCDFENGSIQDVSVNTDSFNKPDKDTGFNIDESMSVDKESEIVVVDVEYTEVESKKTSDEDVESFNAIEDCSSASADILDIFNDLVEVKSCGAKGYIATEDDLPKTPVSRIKANIEAIKVVNRLNESSSEPTLEDQEILNRFSSWGGLGQYFKEDSKYYNELVECLGDYFADARSACKTGYFTPAYIIKGGMYKILSHIGFEKGRILDMSCGTGRFFTYMDKSMYDNSKLYCIDKDPLALQITKYLHPSANAYNCGFEEAILKDDMFDLAICNPPYGDLKIFDKVHKDLNKLKAPIHDHALLKSYKLVRDGGLIMVITTHNTLDKDNSKVLSYLSDKVDFLGAVRLPNNVFNGSSASICTDIIVLRKGCSKNSLDWTTVVDYEQITKNGKDKIVENFVINNYFAKNPNAMLGRLAYETCQTGVRQTLVNSSSLTEKSFDKVLGLFPENSYNPLLDDYYEEDQVNVLDEPSIINKCLSVGSSSANWVPDMRSEEYIYIDGKVYQKLYSGYFKEIEFESNEELDIMRRYLTIKEYILSIVRNRDITDEELKIRQDNLNAEYDFFVEKYGYIGEFLANSSKCKKTKEDRFAYKMIKLMKKDIYTYNYFLALEERIETPQPKGPAIISYKKADIFSKRILGQSKELKEPTTIEEAIRLSYFMTKTLSPEFISEKLNMDLNTVIENLKEDRHMFYNFDSGALEASDVFLSGYTKDKLRYHQNLLYRLENAVDIVTVATEKELFLVSEDSVSRTIKEVKKNILNLEQNQPEYVEEVYFDIASSWIPVDIKRQFIADTVGVGVESIFIHYCEISTRTTVKCNTWIPNVINKSEWGTEKMASMMLVTHAINSTSPVISKKVVIDNKEKYVKDPIETQHAVDKVSKWKRAFDSYISDRPDIHEELVDLYNEKMIRIKNKEIKNIILDPGTNEGIVPRDYQLLGTSMCLLNEYGSLIHFPVGSGKSLIMAMFNRMMDNIFKYTKGRHHKGLIVVPNHLCQSGQAAAEYLKVYADANILALTPSDFKRDNRRRILSKIATNNWEAVIMPQSVFNLIPLRPETEAFYCQKDIDEILSYLSSVDREEAPFAISKLEKMLENKIAHLNRLNDIHKDKHSIYFEDLGFDSICVDEAHHYKSLDFQTRLQVSGVQNDSAKRARNLYNIVRWQRDNGGKVVFCTATPVSNSLCELYTFNRFLAPEVLKAYDVDVFDAWASTFAEIVTNIEVDPIGQSFALKSRLCKFRNIPELMSMYNMFAYYLDPSEIKGVKIPKIANGAPRIIEIEPTDEMLCYSEELIKRWDDFRAKKVHKTEDNPLKITMDGKKSAHDHRLIDEYADFISPKLKKAGEVIAEYYHSDDFSTHMVFADLGCPKGDGSYTSYDTLKNELIKNGVPAEEIAYIHDGAKKDEIRQSILNRFNNGVLRILIGSTNLLGEGVNVQSKLKSLHHICAPWKPASVKQREGRALRYGNIHEEVHIVRYVTKYSFDTFSWQTLEAKARFLAQLFSGKNVSRIADDLNADINEYAAAKASASGNPLVLEQCQVNSRLDELKRLETSFNSQRLRASKELKVTEDKISKLEEDLNILRSEIEIVNSYNYDSLAFELNGYLYREKEVILELLKDRPDLGVFGKAYGLPIRFDSIAGEIKVGNTNLLQFRFVRVPGVIYNRLEFIKNTIGQVLSDNENVLKMYKENKARLEKFVDKVFEYREELEELTVRSIEIESEIKKLEEEKLAKMASEEVSMEDIVKNIEEEQQELMDSNTEAV